MPQSLFSIRLSKMPPKPSAKGAKKAASKAKAARSGDKKRKRKRKESYAIYVYKVLIIYLCPRPKFCGDDMEGTF